MKNFYLLLTICVLTLCANTSSYSQGTGPVSTSQQDRIFQDLSADFNPNANPGVKSSNNFQPDAVFGNWVTLAPSLAISRSCAVYMNIGGTEYIYQIGGGAGAQLRQIARYDIAANTWTTLGQTLTRDVSAGTAINDGDSVIYIFGGNSATTTLGSTQKFNVITGVTTVLATMPTLITDAAVVKYQDSLVYVIGGGNGLFTPAASVNNVNVYNIKTNTYAAATAYPIAASMMGFGIVGNQIVVAGGFNNALTGAPEAYLGTIDPGNHLVINWTQLPNYPGGGVTRTASYRITQQGTTDVPINGIMFTGGALNGATLQNKSYFYNLTCSEWDSTANLPLARSNMKGAGRGDSVMWVPGGFTTVAVGNNDRLTVSNIICDAGIPTYTLEVDSMKLISINTKDDALEFGVYLTHTNAPTAFNLSGQQLYLSFNSGIVNCDPADTNCLKYSIIGSSLPSAYQPVNPSISNAASPSQWVLRLELNPPQGSPGLNITGASNLLVCKMRLQNTAPPADATFENSDFGLAWRNPPTTTLATKVFAYLGSTEVDVTTPATHTIDSSGLPSPPLASLVVPNAYENIPGTGTFLGPLANAQRTYQLLIQASQLSNLVGKNITGFSYRLFTSATANWPPADVNFANYDIYLSGSVEPAARSLTFANNIVGPQTQVRSGPLFIPAGSYTFGSSPNEFGPSVNFNTPWYYSGGNVLIEIRHQGFTGTSSSVDAITTTTGGYGTLISACWTGSYTGTSGSQGNFSVIELKSPGSTNLNLTALIEGLYTSTFESSAMVSDTAKVYLRRTIAPFTLVDSAVSVLDSNGNGTFNFSNALSGLSYYIIVDQRNSIDTWSATGVSFTGASVNYDFTSSQTSAYGENLKLVGSEWTIYSGDVNKDGTIDLTDIIAIANDASSFVTGYVVTDVNGDLSTTLTDLIITYNNAAAFVEEKSPL